MLDFALLISFFACMSIAATMVQFVKHLQSKLRVSNDSQASMLNGMHEGVLILNKELDS